MKRKTFYHISLSLPYIALAVSGALTYFANGFAMDLSNPPGVLLGSLFFFSITAIIWGPLYAWTVAAMLFWGRGKSTAAVRQMYMLSPLLLACSMGLPAFLLGIPDSGLFLLWGFLHMNDLDFIVPTLSGEYYREQSLSIGLAWAFMAALCIVIGYAFVGTVLLTERLMKKRHLFTEDHVADSDISVF